MITFSKRVELTFWSVLPATITLLLILLYLAPKHISGFANIMPLLHLAPVFYWGMQHAREMPYWFVFLAGLLVDATAGMPLGTSSLLYVLFLAMLHGQRKYFHKEGFIIKWGFFCALLMFIGCVQWLVLASLDTRPHGLGAPFMQWLLTACFYPVFHKAFDGITHVSSLRRWRALHGRRF